MVIDRVVTDRFPGRVDVEIQTVFVLQFGGSEPATQRLGAGLGVAQGGPGLRAPAQGGAGRLQAGHTRIT